MSITREAIRALIGQYSALGITGTVDSGSTTTIVDAAIASYARDWPVGSVVYITTDAGGGGAAPEEEQAWLTDFAKATGTQTFSPAMTAAPAAGDTYELWAKEVEAVARVNEAINRALTEFCHYYALTILGMLADGDCQANTGWSVSAGTKATVLAATAFAYPYRFGRLYLDWTATTANDYFYQNIPVSENRNWQLAVLLRTAAATTATVSVYDLANSAAITTSGDTLSVTGLQASGSDWQYLRASFSVPNNCDRVSIRINNGTNSGHTHVAFCQVWPDDTRSLPLPDRIVNDRYVGPLYQATERLDIDFPETWAMREVQAVAVRRQSYGGLAAMFPYTVGTRGPVFFEELCFYDPLNDDDSTSKTGATIGTTDCDDDYAAYIAVWQLMKMITKRQVKDNGLEEAASWKQLEADAYDDANRIARLRAPTGRLVVRRG